MCVHIYETFSIESSPSLFGAGEPGEHGRLAPVLPAPVVHVGLLDGAEGALAAGLAAHADGGPGIRLIHLLFASPTPGPRDKTVGPSSIQYIVSSNSNAIIRSHLL